MIIEFGTRLDGGSIVDHDGKVIGLADEAWSYEPIDIPDELLRNHPELLEAKNDETR